MFRLRSEDGSLLVTVRNGKARGLLEEPVNRLLADGSYRLGAVGPVLSITDKNGWLVAHAMSVNWWAQRRIGIDPPTYIEAYDMDDNPLVMPSRYRKYLSGDFIADVSKSVIMKAGRDQVDNALALLQEVPDVKPGLLASPWPVMQRPDLDDEAWRKSRITTIRIDDLFSSQPYVRRERVEFYIKNPGAIEENRRAFANVYDQDGRLVIVDGHHRLAALWMLGADEALVWLLREVT